MYGASTLQELGSTVGQAAASLPLHHQPEEGGEWAVRWGLCGPLSRSCSPQEKQSLPGVKEDSRYGCLGPWIPVLEEIEAAAGKDVCVPSLCAGKESTSHLP